MKVVEERIRGIFLKFSGVLLASLVTGRFVAGPLTGMLKGNVRDFVLGFGLLSVVCILVNWVWASVLNCQSVQKLNREFPQTLEEVKSIGVETPVDFSYMMGAELSYLRYSAICPIPTLMLMNSPSKIRRGLDMFRELFGREPLAACTGNWDEITAMEIAAMLHREGELIPQEEMVAHVSEQVRQYYRRRN